MSTVDLISNCSSEHPFVCQLSDPGLKIIFFMDLYNSFNIAFVLVNSSLVRFDNFAIHWTQFIMIYTCVVKWLYSELFLIRSRSSRSTPVLRPWKFTSWNLKPTLLELQSKQYHTWCNVLEECCIIIITWNLPGFPTRLSGWLFLYQKVPMHQEYFIVCFPLPVFFEKAKVEWGLGDPTG